MGWKVLDLTPPPESSPAVGGGLIFGSIGLYIFVMQYKLSSGNQYPTLIKLRRFVAFLDKRRQTGAYRIQFRY